MKYAAHVRKMSYLLADKHLRQLPDDVIVTACPEHYGSECTDDHKLFIWNGLVDHYQSLDEAKVYDLYRRHVIEKEPIIKAVLFDTCDEEMQALVSDIVNLIWEGRNM